MGVEYPGRPTSHCWCGNDQLVEFSPDYLRCPACETLVIARMPDPDWLVSTKDEGGFYGRKYYEKYLIEEFGFPDLSERARADLPERCLYWLRTLLRYRLPPGRVLELGSAHGGFVALLRWAGFDAIGLEMSPWLVEFARRTFDVPMLLGPIEEQDLEPASFDAIGLLDVIEHMPDPVGSIRRCAELLKPDGVLLIQTPCYPAGRPHAELVAENAPFLSTMVAPHHLFLFSRNSLKQLLARAGLVFAEFERNLFPYDMFLVGGSQPLSPTPPERIAQRLTEKACGRLVCALLDLDNQLQDVKRRSRIAQAGPGMPTSSTADVLPSAWREWQAGASVEKPGHSGLLAWIRVLGTRLFPLKGGGRARQVGQKSKLRRVVVDLTPVLPGGQNGGSKIMTIELIRSLAARAKGCEFLLLTASESHEELAALDRPNVRRLCVDGLQAEPDYRDTAERAGAQKHCQPVEDRPGDPRGLIISSLGTSARWGAPLVRTLGADLLFCPFTAPRFYDPSVPTVAVLYDLQHLDCPQFFEDAERTARHDAFRQACRLASRLVCISDYMRDRVLKEGLISPHRVRTVRIRLAKRLSPPGGEVVKEVLERYGLERDGYLLYPANFWPHKNHEALLEAFAIHCGKRPSSALKLALTGAPGPRMEVVRTMAADLGLSERIIFAGFLPNVEFAALLYGSLGVVFPSLYEGWGMPVVEAMAAGKPVIASKLTSVPEAAGGAAVLCDPRKPQEIAAAIDRLERDHAWRLALAERGLSRAAHLHDPLAMAMEYWQTFEEAVADPPSPPPAVYAVHADGWVGNRFVVLLNDGPPGRRLYLTVWAPPWSGEHGTTLFLPHDLGKGDSLHYIPASETSTLERLLPETASFWEVLVSPVHQLNVLGLSPDTRPLGCRILNAEIRYPNGESLPLDLSTYGI